MRSWTTTSCQAPRSPGAARRASGASALARIGRLGRWLDPWQLGLAAALTFALTACPGAPPPAKAPSEPDMSVDEPQHCAAGDDESGNCIPEGCVNPPEPEEGSGGAGAEDEIDCSKWDD